MHLWRSAFFSYSSLRKVSRKPKILNRMWCYCCFHLHWILLTDKVLLIIRCRGQIWGKKLCLQSKNYGKLILLFPHHPDSALHWPVLHCAPGRSTRPEAWWQFASSVEWYGAINWHSTILWTVISNLAKIHPKIAKFMWKPQLSAWVWPNTTILWTCHAETKHCIPFIGGTHPPMAHIKSCATLQLPMVLVRHVHLPVIAIQRSDAQNFNCTHTQKHINLMYTNTRLQQIM